MKLLIFITLLISILAFSPRLSAQATTSQNEVNQRVTSLQKSAGLSTIQKKVVLQKLLQNETQSTQRDLNIPITLILNDALLAEMRSSSEIIILFESFELLNDANKTNENINDYVNVLLLASSAYLKLQDYDNAEKLITEVESYLPLFTLENSKKGRFYMAAGQLAVRRGKYKDGLTMLKLAVQVFEQNTHPAKTDKRGNISLVYNYIGATYASLGDHKNAIKYYEKMKNPFRNNIAEAQLELLNWEQALKNGLLAEQQAQNIEWDEGIASANQIMARANHGLGKTAEAIEFMQVVIDTYKSIEHTQSAIIAIAYQAQFNISLGNWDGAIKNVAEGHRLREISGIQTEPSIELLNASYLVAENNNNAQKALFYHKQLLKLKEAEFAVKKEHETQRLMLYFDYHLADERALRLAIELDLAIQKSSGLEQENRLNGIIIEKNNSQNTLLISLVSGAVLALFLLVYVFLRERNLKIKMSYFAMTDYLTGCPNRRNAMSQAEKMLTTLVSKKDSMVVAILDVDNFKTINDTYGHDVGDKVLQNLASIISNALRESDVIGRYGGEEFIVLLPSAGEKEIKMIFSRIQLALKSHRCEYNDDSIALPVTISIGASVVSNVQQKLNDTENKLLLDSTIKQADEKAYEAKKAGKDQLKLVISKPQ